MEEGGSEGRGKETQEKMSEMERGREGRMDGVRDGVF